MSSSLEMLFPCGVDLVDLPSQGKFYDKDHPLCNQKYVELSHMRGAEEDIITNKEFIKKDIMIDKLLKSLLKDSSLRLDLYYNKMLVADQVALILKARTTAYTWEYPTSFVCPSCKTNCQYTFDLRKFESKHPNLENDENISYDESTNEFSIKIPNVDLTLKTKPLTIEIQKKISAKLIAKKDKILSSKEKLEDQIVSVNGESSRKIVDELFKQAPAFYIKWMESAINDTNVQVNLEQQFQCSNCGFEDTITPPFTTDFLFTPKIMRTRS